MSPASLSRLTRRRKPSRAWRRHRPPGLHRQPGRLPPLASQRPAGLHRLV